MRVDACGRRVHVHGLVGVRERGMGGALVCGPQRPPPAPSPAAPYPGFPPAFAARCLCAKSTHQPPQVNGKMRGAVEVEVGTPQEGAVEAARAIPAVAKQLEGKDVKKVIFVPGALLLFLPAACWLAVCRWRPQLRSRAGGGGRPPCWLVVPCRAAPGMREGRRMCAMGGPGASSCCWPLTLCCLPPPAPPAGKILNLIVPGK